MPIGTRALPNCVIAIAGCGDSPSIFGSAAQAGRHQDFPAFGVFRLVRLAAQDAGLSSRQQGFNSPTSQCRELKIGNGKLQIENWKTGCFFNLRFAIYIFQFSILGS